MEDNLDTMVYDCMRRPTHEEIEFARKHVANQNILTGKDKLHAYYQSIGYDDIFAELKILLINSCMKYVTYLIG